MFVIPWAHDLADITSKDPGGLTWGGTQGTFVLNGGIRDTLAGIQETIEANGLGGAGIYTSTAGTTMFLMRCHGAWALYGLVAEQAANQK